MGRQAGSADVQACATEGKSGVREEPPGAANWCAACEETRVLREGDVWVWAMTWWAPAAAAPGLSPSSRSKSKSGVT